MRKYINIIEDVHRGLIMPDPDDMIVHSNMKHLTTIDGIEFHVSMSADETIIDMVFIKPNQINEFIFIPKDYESNENAIGKCSLCLAEEKYGQKFYEFDNISIKSELRGKGFGYKLYNWILNSIGLKTSHILTPFSFAIWKKMSADPQINTWYFDENAEPHELSDVISDTVNHYPAFYASKHVEPVR